MSIGWPAGLSIAASGGRLTGRQLDAVAASAACALRLSALLGLCRDNPQAEKAAFELAGVKQEDVVRLAIWTLWQFNHFFMSLMSYISITYCYYSPFL
eukprot:scaffold5419_cov19-Prasinocladus_malaysianus.AAC.1